MKKILSIVTLAALMAGSSALACNSCGCAAKKGKGKAVCTACGATCKACKKGKKARASKAACTSCGTAACGCK